MVKVDERAVRNGTLLDFRSKLGDSSHRVKQKSEFFGAGNFGQTERSCKPFRNRNTLTRVWLNPDSSGIKYFKMYRVDREANTIREVKAISFSEAKFKERDHLQEWISKVPAALGEDLLIIQKEFKGFSETNERLDLLALDKHGDLVVIENKLDDSGRDVVWQALKYASYCSSLTRSQIAEAFQAYLTKTRDSRVAHEVIADFLGAESFDDVVLNKGVSQRIILVAANFRREVTSTVMWLLANDIRLQCVKVTLHEQEDQQYLATEQILPTPEEAEFRVSIKQKRDDEENAIESIRSGHNLCREFWSRALHAMEAAGVERFETISPSEKHYISCGTGFTSIKYSLVICRHRMRVELYLEKKDAALNRRIFDAIYAKREEIHADFGGPLVWQSMDQRKACRIEFGIDVETRDKGNWEDMTSWLIEHFNRFERVMQPFLDQAMQRFR